jgi:hypothetical protein
LSYDEFVTRHMSSLDGRAHWRVTPGDGEQVPIALVVRVQAREDIDDPEKVTNTYLAVAKITPHETCITERIAAGAGSEAELHSAADSAQNRPCAPPQPPLAPQ